MKFQGTDIMFDNNNPTLRAPYEVKCFESFVQNKLENIHLLKKGLIIRIDGSYYPPREKDRLIQLKTFLISEGYESTRLVEDYPKKESRFCLSIPHEEEVSWKSECCLEFSDLNFFIFTNRGKCQGVSVELAYCRNSLTMIDRRWRCIIFDEVLRNHPATSLMNRSSAYFTYGTMRRIKFTNDVELLTLARDTALEFLYILHPYLEQRIRLLTDKRR